jgi:hypothetical protein
MNQMNSTDAGMAVDAKQTIKYDGCKGIPV